MDERFRRVMPLSPPLSAALRLLSDGYAVFPCRDDKRPACPHGFKDAVSASNMDTGDAQNRLRDLWRQYPGALVGVVTGAPSGVVVLDIDRKPGASAWWASHRTQLMPTRVHRTRSGGLHLLYVDPCGLRCSASKIAPGIDVRADGGYVIWWPAAGLPVLSGALVPAPWPPWLPTGIPAEAETQTRTPGSSISRRLTAKAPRLAQTDRRNAARIHGLCQRIIAASDGEQNNIINWATWQIRQMGLDTQTCAAALKAIEAAAYRGNHPPARTARTIASAMGARNGPPK